MGAYTTISPRLTTYKIALSEGKTMPEDSPHPVVVDTSNSLHARLKPVPISAVNLTDSFWEPRRRVNRKVTLPSQFRHCEETGRLDNFRRASGKKQGDFQGIFFNDSDIYKWLEAAAWALATDSDPALAGMVDTAITEIEDAQQPDGYLNTYFTFEKAKDRYSNLKDMHELYCAGHLIQAAVAHHRATGSDRLLRVAIKLADHICDTFGLEEEGKRSITDGHEEIELALVELARDTGEICYQKQAQFFVDIRGRGTIGGNAYHQDHEPFRDLARMTGHAVRMVYYTSGATDLFLETGEPAMRMALDRLWDNMVHKQMYVSGGIGSRHEGEAFGRDYELPNERAYTETCAAIGSVMWSWRMLAISGEAKYADVMELALYNAVLPGLSLDGQSYFYDNPLADDGTHRRQAWFGCACCPPNVARLLASLPGYFYSVSTEGVWVHLYAEGAANLTLTDGRTVSLKQETRYPWDGEVSITVDGEGEFSLFLRIPGWCEQGASITINGKPLGGSLTPGSYAEIQREWKAGDKVCLTLPMPVRQVECHPNVAENVGRVTLMRGPLLYCVEAADNPGVHPQNITLPENAEFKVEWRGDLMGGVLALRSEAEVGPPDSEWGGKLYRTSRKPQSQTVNREITAIPYYAWANREAGAMRVWLRKEMPTNDQ
jgi:DUF1680 family protein